MATPSSSIEAPPLAKSAGSAVPPRHLIDVVATVSDLKSIDAWRKVLSRYHVVVITVGSTDSNVSIDLPDYVLHSLHEARNTLGDPNLLAHTYGILVSTRKYVVLLDLDHTAPIHEHDDPVERHLTNLSTPATPYFFNTLYDPFRPGADFVRGYPFSLRTGIATAVSNGLWCEDARPTVVDAVLTIPVGVFFPMSSSNVALDRELVGAAIGCCSSNMLLGGLLVKVICDHLGYGVKSGLPYVKRTSAADDKDELSGDVLEFFSSIKLSSTAQNAEDCVLEITKEMSKADKLSIVAKSMEGWIHTWNSKKASYLSCPFP